MSKRQISRMVLLGTSLGISLTNYAFSLLTGWLLVPGDFGLLAFAQTLLTMAALILNSGFTWSLAAALVHQPQQHHAPLIRGAALANMLLALVMSTSIVVGFALGPLKHGLETPSIAWLVALSLVPLAGIAVVRSTAQGFERFWLLALVQIVEVLGKVIGGAAFILAGCGASGAIAGFLIGGLLAWVLGLCLLKGVCNVALFGGVQWPAFKRVRGMFGALIGMALLLNLDMMMLKLVAPSQRSLIGHYQAALVLANMPYYVAAALLPLFFTQAARFKDIPQTAAIVGDALRLVLLVLVPIEMVFVLAPELMITLLFPPTYAAGTDLLRLLALGNCALMLIAIVGSLFQALHHAHIPARILLILVGTEALLLPFTIRFWLATGAALTFLGTAVLALIIVAAVYGRFLEKQEVRAALSWVSRYSLALAIGSCTGLLVWNSGHMGIGACMLGAISYGLCALGFQLIALPAWQRMRHPWAAAPLTEQE